MNNLLTLFSNNLLPILLTAAVGFLIGKFLQIDSKTVSRITFYVFSPSLIFNLLTTSELTSSAIFQTVGFAVCMTVLIGLIAFFVSSLLKFDKPTTIAIVMTVMFTNAGNFGLSLINFAFGADALAYASVYFVTSAMMMYTIGVTLASMGSASFKETLIRLIRLPAIYAVVLAVLVNTTGLQLPVFATKSIGILGDAAIPMMLILLGIQLQRVDLKQNLKELSTAVVLRLVGAPILAVIFAGLFQLSGPTRQAGIIEASMPTAVMSIVLATEFDVKPALVTSIVTATTIVSPLTLTPLISLLGG